MKDDADYRMGYGLLSVTDKRFEHAMYFHDWAYRADSDAQRTGMTRKEIDDRFLDMMLVAASDDWIARRRAWFYYRIVRAVGGIFWEGKK